VVNHQSISNIYVFTSDKDAELLTIAAQNGFPVVDEVSDSNALYLLKKDGKLSLQADIDGDLINASVDFISAEMEHRLKQGHGKNQALAKAIGLNKKSGLRIVDATAGLGRDSFILASLGCDVLMVERSIPVALLLADGLVRAKENEQIQSVISRLSLKVDNSEIIINALNEKPDVIYLDPMFPERKKSAKVKKEMQLLQRLHGHETDDDTLLQSALQSAKRVVVKRPKGAEPFCSKPPSHVIETKKMRYDVYMCF